METGICFLQRLLGIREYLSSILGEKLIIRSSFAITSSALDRLPSLEDLRPPVSGTGFDPSLFRFAISR